MEQPQRFRSPEAQVVSSCRRRPREKEKREVTQNNRNIEAREKEREVFQRKENTHSCTYI